jgi:hypothetical protein
MDVRQGHSGTYAITGGSITGVSGVPYVVGQSFTSVSGSADTNENILGTTTIPAGALSTGGGIRVKFKFTYTNSANNKTLRVRFGGIAGTLYLSVVQTTSASTWGEVILGNAGATNSQQGFGVYYTGSAGITGPSGAVITSAIDTTAATTLVITGQKATAGETLTLEMFTAELLRYA